MKKLLHFYIKLWSFWLETGEETKELLDIPYTFFFLSAEKIGQKIANETGKIVYLRKSRTCDSTCLQYEVYPKKQNKNNKKL